MQVAASIFGFLMALAVLASQISVIVDRHLHAAEHDPLTDVLNRRGFERRVPDFREGAPVGAVIACDIDHFKQINDRFGHAAGDIVLIGLSDLLKGTISENGLVARFGERNLSPSCRIALLKRRAPLPKLRVLNLPE